MVDKPYAVRPSNAIKTARRNMLTLMSGNQHTLNANQVKKKQIFHFFPVLEWAVQGRLLRPVV